MANTAYLMWMSISSPLAINTFNTNTSTTSVCTNTVTAPANCLLVVSTTQTNAITVAPNGAITSVPSLTWTKQVKAGLASTGNAEIWTAPFAAGGSITTTATWASGTGQSSSVLYVLVNQNASPIGNFNSSSSVTSSPSVSITTTGANSILICNDCDWNVNVGTRTYLDGATEALNYNATGGENYHFYNIKPTIGSYTEGMSSPTGQNYGCCVLEIKSI